MAAFHIAVIPGDGIGIEVIDQALRVADRASRHDSASITWNRLPWSSTYYKQHGRMMPADALERLRPFDAIFFGAVGDPGIQDNVTLNGLLLPIRRGFDQYACVRPAVLYPGVRAPLAGRKAGDIEFVVVRENTEGEYAQIGGALHSGGARQSHCVHRCGPQPKPRGNAVEASEAYSHGPPFARSHHPKDR